MRYGLYDTVDDKWLGGDDGPRTFGAGDIAGKGVLDDKSAHILARVSAEAACYVLDWHPTRVVAREIPDGAWRPFDEIEKTDTEVRWLTMKERGTIP